ncbi:MAG TPA: bifunctional DNA-formamidopyrimidine glycosylase/DNA-(apurinic or apyrimidinic site) lyase [Pyrinomonadaceae bacterium]|nr:bifunctional DNA-formamidopyrimidine glycosylase/DNA-(apurinic or apyrimidinic site) lyase [Pyrinomonadaceae bacterium]
MPELPEVELVARALGRLLQDRRILRASLLRPGLAPSTTPEEFKRLLKGRRVEQVARRGKHVLIHLSSSLVLITHLRMTGSFLLLPRGSELRKHTHALFHLDDGRMLAFTDQRHFAMMKLVRAHELSQAKELSSLAPEPFSDEFTDLYLRDALQRSRRTLKETLIDQRRVTGLGNIYAAEAMFLARTNPFQSARELSARRVPALHRAIRHVLEEAIRHGSRRKVDPENIDGSYFGGGIEGRWRVYDREGEPCLKCSAKIQRISHGGRSTYFCPRCQRS